MLIGFGEQSVVRGCLRIATQKQYMRELFEPLAIGLLQPIQRLDELANLVRTRRRKALWECHVDILMEIPVQKMRNHVQQPMQVEPGWW